MTVHHFTPGELRDLTAQIESRPTSDPTLRGFNHGPGNHWLRFAQNGDTTFGRYCDFPGCEYTDWYVGPNTIIGAHVSLIWEDRSGVGE